MERIPGSPYQLRFAEVFSAKRCNGALQGAVPRIRQNSYEQRDAAGWPGFPALALRCKAEGKLEDLAESDSAESDQRGRAAGGK